MPASNRYTTGTPAFDSRDLISGFYPNLEDAMLRLRYLPLAYEVDMERETVQLGWLGQVPMLREWVGARQEQTINKYAHVINSRKFEDTVPISIDDLRRDRTGSIRRRVDDLGVMTAMHWDLLFADLIETGTAGTNGLAYDGQFFFDTDHNESGTNQSNDLTATEIPSANVAAPATPTQVEASAIINEVTSYMQSLKDDQGNPINTNPLSYTIVCSKHTIAAAFRSAVRLSNLGTTGADNIVTANMADGYNYRVMLDPRLTAANAVYFLVDNSGSGKPFIYGEELRETSMIGVGSEEAFKFDRYIFGVKAIRGVAYGMWQSAAYVALS